MLHIIKEVKEVKEVKKLKKLSHYSFRLFLPPDIWLNFFNYLTS